jgi:flagellar export protein FliJ
MKRFVFTLQKLYDVKEAQEDEKRKELKGLDKKLDELAARLRRMADTFENQKRKYAAAGRRGLSVFDVKNYGDYFQFLIGEMAEVNGLILECEAEIDRCRQELLKLINEQKVLERMRGEQLEAYHAEIAKFNEKEIEDFMQGRL